MQNGYFLLLITGLYPPLFFASKNWFVLPGHMLIQLLLLTPLMVILIGWPLLWLLEFASKLLNKKFAVFQKFDVKPYLIAYLAAGILFCFMRKLVFSQQFPVSVLLSVKFLLIYLLPSLAIITIAVRIKGLFFPNFILSLLCALSLSSFSISYIQSLLHKNNAVADATDFSSVKLNETPNIYIINLESYSGQDAMKKYLGVDNSDLENFLKKNGFSIYSPAYSNYRHTLNSLSSFLTMSFISEKSNAGNHDSYYGRNIICGNKLNNANNILTRNGYKTQHVLRDGYTVSSNIKDLDYYYPRFNIIETFGTVYSIWRISDYFEKKHRKQYKIEVQNALERATKSPEPYFSFFRLPGTYHAAEGDKTLESFVERYREYLPETNGYIKQIVEYLSKNDPNAVIVVCGDHGVRILNLFDFSGQEERMESDFDILLGIKWPENHKNDKYKIHTLVNVLRFVFYDLSGDELLMQTIQPERRRGDVVALDAAPIMQEPENKQQTEQTDAK